MIISLPLGGKALNIRSTRYKESSYITEKQIKAHAPEGKAFCFIKIQTPKKSEPANQRGVCASFLLAIMLMKYILFEEISPKVRVDPDLR